MTRGKSICSVLKTIRKQVADANHIKYEPRECHHEGECRGTCPACEAEVRYLERQLDLRRQLGKAVTVIGISAGLSALSGCAPSKKVDHAGGEESGLTEGVVRVDTVERLDGDVEYRSPVDSVIVEKEPAAVKKRTAPFKTPATKQQKSSSAVTEEDEEMMMMGKTGYVEEDTIVFSPDRVYDVVEQMPRFPGGSSALASYFEENMRYPEEAKAAGLQGRVILTFIIEKDGSITEPKVVKSVAPALDEEALRLIKEMPKWVPGRQNGVTLRVKYTLPVTFRL